MSETMICHGQTIAEILAAIHATDITGAWAKRISYMQPKNVLELGTGQGVSGAQIMAALPLDSTFTTINYDYPSAQEFGEQLNPLAGDSRLKRIIADTLDPATLELVPDGVDLLFIDTTHEAWHAAEELRAWQRKLQNGAIVIVDDLSHHDMKAFWKSLPYEKMVSDDQGIFRYDADKYYAVMFPRGKTSKEEALG